MMRLKSAKNCSQGSLRVGKRRTESGVVSRHRRGNSGGRKKLSFLLLYGNVIVRGREGWNPDHPREKGGEEQLEHSLTSGGS